MWEKTEHPGTDRIWGENGEFWGRKENMKDCGRAQRNMSAHKALWEKEMWMRTENYGRGNYWKEDNAGREK